MPATFTPSAVIETLESPTFWKNAGPAGRYHISLLFHSDPSPNMLSDRALSMAPVVAAGVEGPNMDADPVGKGKDPVLTSNGVAEMFTGVPERSASVVSSHARMGTGAGQLTWADQHGFCFV